MSTAFRLIKTVAARDLFDGRLENFGVHEDESQHGSTETSRCLRDGRNFVWVYISADGLVTTLNRFGVHAPGKILEAVADAFDTSIVSEYQPQFWGFDTEEEWDAWAQKEEETAEESFHVELLKYLRGEPNDIGPESIGMLMAKIAKTLVEEDPSLLLPTNKNKFLNEIERVYRDDSVEVTLSPQQQAQFWSVVNTLPQ
jgi:hypothetical protein